MDEYVAPWSLLLCVSQHVIKPGPSSLTKKQPTHALQQFFVLKDLLVVFLAQRFVFRVLVAERLLLGRCTGQLLQLSCLPVSAFKLRRPFALSFSACSSLSCRELSLQKQSTAQRPVPSESDDRVDAPAEFTGSVWWLHRHSMSVARFTRAAGTAANTRLSLRQWWPCRFHRETP